MNEALQAEAACLVAQYLSESEQNRKENPAYWQTKLTDLPSAKAIIEAEPAAQVAILGATLHEEPYPRKSYLSDLRGRLLLRNLPLSPFEIEALIVWAASTDYYEGSWPQVVRHLRRLKDAGLVLTGPMQTALDTMYAWLAEWHGTNEARKLKIAIDELRGRQSDFLPDAGEAWADAARAEVGESEIWEAVFTHTGTATGGKPSGKWLNEAQRRRSEVEGEFVECVTRWFQMVKCPSPFDRPAPVFDDYVQAAAPGDHAEANAAYRAALYAYHNGSSEKNKTILKGLAWYASALERPELARAVGHLTNEAFKSVAAQGAWAKSAGNAAIWALGQMPDGLGVGPLACLRTRLKDRGALKLIATAIEEAAKASGMTVDELEDLAVPTGGLELNGTRHTTFGDQGSAILTLDTKNAKTTLAWFGPDGKPRKAVPAGIKKDFAAEVKELKAAADEIDQALTAQSARFDTFFLQERTWPLSIWRERYLSHPVLSNLTRRLIWTFDGKPGLPDTDVLDSLPDETIVRLWHPLMSEPQEVMRWRDVLEERQFVQPFKQAHREVYLLTDAERTTRTYSNRFAAHILKQHQFNTLCVLRGWRNTLRLMVDDSYPPATRELPQFNLRAEFWIEGIGEDYGVDTNDAGTYLRVVTDQVRFYRPNAPVNYAHAGGGGYSVGYGRQPSGEALPLEEIPPLVLSEILRDVDLFVGVASLGNDPTWADGGPTGRFRNYWQDYAFGDLSATAKTRADVLARLLPRLKIAAQSELDGKFLVVRGSLRTYKIHLGSGNILMEPNDQYLCIVPTSRGEDTGDLFLPFAGDRMLAIILSKAFLLADDTKITDPTITRQIGVN